MKNIINQAYIELLNIKDCTHELSCRHSMNHRSGFDYNMNCIILKEMPNDKLKILVFGDRYWKGHDHKKRIRYVDKSRVKPNSNFIEKVG
jgi:hypothetical protein